MPMTRDEKDDFHRAWSEAYAAVVQINGPWSAQDKAMRLMQDLLGAATDDEVMGLCEVCEAPLWVSDDTWVSSDDGVRQCAECTRHLSEGAS